MHRTVRDVARMKGEGRRICALAVYDYTMATLCDDSADVLLVGDSAGMVMLGYESTIPVSMREISLFTGAVSRARRKALLVSDMPFMSYQAGTADAVRNAGRLIKAGADAVKLEGGSGITDTVSGMVRVGIPVMGHIGVQPQTTTLSQGYRVQGATAEDAMRLLDEAVLLEQAGAFAIVLEMVAAPAAAMISREIGIPTIGIGSGSGCDGQVLVIQDMLGMYEKLRPRFVKRYMNLSDGIRKAVEEYKTDVAGGKFPGDENSFAMEDGEVEELHELLEARRRRS